MKEKLIFVLLIVVLASSIFNYLSIKKLSEKIEKIKNVSNHNLSEISEKEISSTEEGSVSIETEEITEESIEQDIEQEVIEEERTNETKQKNQTMEEFYNRTEITNQTYEFAFRNATPYITLQRYYWYEQDKKNGGCFSLHPSSLYLFPGTKARIAYVIRNTKTKYEEGNIYRHMEKTKRYFQVVITPEAKKGIKIEWNKEKFALEPNEEKEFFIDVEIDPEAKLDEVLGTHEFNVSICFHKSKYHLSCPTNSTTELGGLYAKAVIRIYVAIPYGVSVIPSLTVPAYLWKYYIKLEEPTQLYLVINNSLQKEYWFVANPQIPTYSKHYLKQFVSDNILEAYSCNLSKVSNITEECKELCDYLDQFVKRTVKIEERGPFKLKPNEVKVIPITVYIPKDVVLGYYGIVIPLCYSKDSEVKPEECLYGSSKNEKLKFFRATAINLFTNIVVVKRGEFVYY